MPYAIVTVDVGIFVSLTVDVDGAETVRDAGTSVSAVLNELEAAGYKVTHFAISTGPPTIKMWTLST